MTEQWVDEARAVGERPPRSGFRAELRGELTRRWEVARPGVATRTGRRRKLAIAAAIATGVVGSGIFAWAGGRGESGTVLTTEPGVAPDITSPTSGPTSTQSVSSSVPNPERTDSVAVDAEPIVTWLEQLDAVGLPAPLVSLRAGAGTTARLIVDSGDEVTGEAAVLLDDRLVVPLPDPQMRVVDALDGQPSITTLGDRLAVIVRRNDVAFAPPELWLLDAKSFAWSPGPALVDGPMSSWTITSVAPFADGIIVMIWDVTAHSGQQVDADLVPTTLVAVSGDLVVTPLNPPPDEDVALFDAVTGERVFSVIDTLGNRGPAARPWAYDVATDSWTAVSNPPWLPCSDTDTCDWSTSDNDDRRAVVVGTFVLVEVQSEDLGLLDGRTLEWSDAPEPPFSLRAHHLIAIADDLVLAMPTDDVDGPSIGEAGLLDLTDRTWTTFVVEADLARYRWSPVHEEGVVLLGDHGVEPVVVFDLAAREFRDASTAENDLWFDRMTGWSFSFRADELIAAYTSRGD